MVALTQREGPEPCHYDRDRGERVTKRHRDDCPNPATHKGCAPCTAPHCTICGREHLDNNHPITGEKCVIGTQEDLDDILAADQLLAEQAIEGEGLAYASAPIPGHNAAVLRGPSVRLDALLVSRHTHEDHRRGDPIPPLAVLAQWEDMWRQWFGHDVPTRRVTLARTIGYLRERVPAMAQEQDGGPDWLAFARQVRTLRSRLEHQLHDEREHEQGVECFECGDQLERRFRTRKTCRHDTAARRSLRKVMTTRQAPAAWLDLLRGYGIPATDYEIKTARLPSNQLMQAARLPCTACSKTGQGGLDNPMAGQSWECPGCRKQYDPGEYATAVRRSLLDGDGWTTIANASAAAATLTGAHCGDRTIRSWVHRGWVDSYMTVQANGLPGLRLVFWPDVKREALRLAAGLQHCKHSTPARAWLRVLESYELEAWDDEIQAAREECGTCSLAVREVRGHAGAVTVA